MKEYESDSVIDQQLDFFEVLKYDLEKVDYIAKVAQLIKTDKPNEFQAFFREWILNSVENLFEIDSNKNSDILVFCGGDKASNYRFIYSLFDNRHLQTIYPKARKGVILRALADSFIVVLDVVPCCPKDINFWMSDRVIIKRRGDKYERSYPRMANICAVSDWSSTTYTQAGVSAFDLIAPIDLTALEKNDIAKMWKQAYNVYQLAYPDLPF